MKNYFVRNISSRGQNLPMIFLTKNLGDLMNDQLRFSDHINQIRRKK